MNMLAKSIQKYTKGDPIYDEELNDLISYYEGIQNAISKSYPIPEKYRLMYSDAIQNHTSLVRIRDIRQEN
jgi:hypothetical protein